MANQPEIPNKVVSQNHVSEDSEQNDDDDDAPLSQTRSALRRFGNKDSVTPNKVNNDGDNDSFSSLISNNNLRKRRATTIKEPAIDPLAIGKFNKFNANKPLLLLIFFF